ncbi:alpha/beta fold hydrolase [Cohnella rhizosphaerae]|uniref:Alpha/beta hydrolase n=1 Tax=Cohnella rhizosphaerae TaxID=1457232 RepID=A0A9X4KW30_9BACL|nr:alpha/beta hydrolase [Cohnella rhizosphaerae]MDG0811997.1 alpha/beta hydrolase [Cohnella rhizosphaerae]
MDALASAGLRMKDNHAIGGNSMSHYVEVQKGIRIYVEDIGEGTPIIFLHGWPLNHKMFEYQYLELPRLGYRCIGIDLRGFGKSDASWDGYNYCSLADDVKAVIDHLGVSGATLVGFSLGGAVAVRYMARHAGHGISRLLLVGAAAPSFVQREDFKHGTPPEKVEDMILQAYADRPALAAQFGKMLTASKPSAGMAAWLQSLAFEASAVGTYKALESLRTEDLREDLPLIGVPTAIFHGVQDEICPFALAEEIRRLVPASTLHRFEESGHAVPFDEPQLFSERLTAFLADTRVVPEPIEVSPEQTPIL